MDESNLTGETRPVRKSTGVIGENIKGTIIPVTDRKNTVFMGTLVRFLNLSLFILTLLFKEVEME